MQCLCKAMNNFFKNLFAWFLPSSLLFSFFLFIMGSFILETFHQCLVILCCLCIYESGALTTDWKHWVGGLLHCGFHGRVIWPGIPNIIIFLYFLLGYSAAPENNTLLSPVWTVLPVFLYSGGWMREKSWWSEQIIHKLFIWLLYVTRDTAALNFTYVPWMQTLFSIVDRELPPTFIRRNSLLCGLEEGDQKANHFYIDF